MREYCHAICKSHYTKKTIINAVNTTSNYPFTENIYVTSPSLLVLLVVGTKVAFAEPLLYCIHVHGQWASWASTCFHCLIIFKFSIVSTVSPISIFRWKQSLL